MAIHSSSLAWKISWAEEPGRLQSMGSRRVGHDWSNLAPAAAVNHSPKKKKKKKICKTSCSVAQSLSRAWLFATLWFVAHLREGNGTPLQYSCLENPMDGGAWWATVHGVTKSQTRLSDFTLTFHFHALEKEIATHSGVLAWRIPGTGSLVGCRLWACIVSDLTEAT